MATRILSSAIKVHYRARMFAPAGGRGWRSTYQGAFLQLKNVRGMGRNVVTARSTHTFNSRSLQIAKAVRTRSSSTMSPPESLTALFNEAEASFPPRFREHGWYLTMASQSEDDPGLIVIRARAAADEVLRRWHRLLEVDSRSSLASCTST